MPPWVKYAIVFGLGFAIGKDPVGVGHAIQQLFNGIGHK